MSITASTVRARIARDRAESRRVARATRNRREGDRLVFGHQFPALRTPGDLMRRHGLSLVEAQAAVREGLLRAYPSTRRAA